MQAKNFARKRLAPIVCLVGWLLVAPGCKENPGTWPPEKIAPIVGRSLEVSDLKLSETSAGLEGSGKRSDGETVKVTVTLNPSENSFSWSATGDRGTVDSGSYALE